MSETTPEPDRPGPDMPIPVATAEAIAQRVADQIDGITPEQVNTVLATLEHVRGGDPVGMVRRDEDTGKVAHRVNEAGITPLWRVSDPNGDQYNDLQPTLPWSVLYEPEA